MSKKLKTVVIGAGALVFNMHRPALQQDFIDLVAVSDINREAAARNTSEFDCDVYTDTAQMLADAQPDLAIIITPHPLHAAQTIVCLEAGCHVLVEKPMAVDVAEADRMLATAEKADRLIALNFQQRFRPEVKAAHQLIQNGFIGEIQHVDMALSWPRTAAYYANGGWRATWKGEGGGVLMNQAPHDLDLICHLLGQPKKVYAWTRTLLQTIEVEDTIQAMMEWPNGGMGSIHISTAEGKRPYRLEIIGTKGTLNIAQGSIECHLFDEDIRDTITKSSEGFPQIKAHPYKVELPDGSGDHVAVYQNLRDAILEGKPLKADGKQGIQSLELANAMIYSSHHKKEVDLPLDREAYSNLLKMLQDGVYQ